MAKRYALLLLAVVCLVPFVAGTSSAQVTTIQIGSLYFVGNYTPFDAYYPAQKTQIFYSATEMNAAMAAAGLAPGPAFIKSVAFEPYWSYGSYAGANTFQNFSVKMGNSPIDKVVWTAGAPFISVPDQCYGPKTWTITPNAPWLKWDFDNFFSWNGSDHIIVETCYEDGTSYYTRTGPYYWSLYYYPPQYPPYVPAQWWQGAGTGACTTATVQNGWVNANNTVRFEVCTGPQTQLDFDAPAFVSLPGPIPVQYSIFHPSLSFTATLTFRFYTPGGTLVYTESTQVPVVANTLVSGTYNVDASALSPGYYRMEVTANVMTPCNALGDVKWDKALMALNPGQVPCIVWPGDVNRDDIVNWADRNALHTYILDANLDPLWLNGPARWRVDSKTDPLTYIRWEAQAGVPWYTADGCYMDTDGNGVVNSMDYLAIKINWMKTTDSYSSFTKDRTAFNSLSFDMDQNYPNPFNPTTKIQYSVPEASQVQLTVTDMLGRTVASQVKERVEAGVHSEEFNGSSFNSGSYVATINMTGLETGTTFSKTIKMTLAK